jgi:hypothetical protein
MLTPLLQDRYYPKGFINCTRFSHPRGQSARSLANNTSLSCIILTRGGRHRGRRFFYGRWSTKRWQRNRGLPSSVFPEVFESIERQRGVTHPEVVLNGPRILPDVG